ncbi:MAG: SDR family NAD(P)-dependent oxidoreductase [Oxalobacteraceae bacterium]|nr:SDR family NAD(P)-dependent oxidoreductase [Oxalobacteraceae bacterium]
MTRPRIVIVGATSAIAEHCARLWVRAAVDIVLLGRDLVRVSRVATDLRVRSPHSSVTAHEVNFLDPAGITVLAQKLASEKAIDVVLIAHGNLPDQTECQHDVALARDALEINGVSPVLFAEAFAHQMEQVGRGTIAIIGSVAGDRGRKTNYVYGAAKGMVERYVQGLQHRFAHSKITIVLIKPGPTATPMTAHLPQRGMATAQAVASRIVAAIASGTPVVYVPAKWAVIMMVIRHLPRAIFNKLNI